MFTPNAILHSHYGAQAVVVSIDPKRVYVSSPEVFQYDDAADELARKTIVPLRENESGPNGEKFCWWQVTVKGGRETRDIDAIQLAKVMIQHKLPLSFTHNLFNCTHRFARFSVLES